MMKLVMMHGKTYLHLELPRLHAKQQVVEAVPNLGHHDEHLHLLRHGPDVVGHLVRGGQLGKRPREVLGRGGAGLGPKVHAHEEAPRRGVAELLEVEHIVPVGGEDGRHGVDDARLVGAREREDVVVVVGHGGRVRVFSNAIAATGGELSMWSGAAGMGIVEVTQTSGRWEFLVELWCFFLCVCVPQLLSNMPNADCGGRSRLGVADVLMRRVIVGWLPPLLPRPSPLRPPR